MQAACKQNEWLLHDKHLGYHECIPFALIARMSLSILQLILEIPLMGSLLSSL